MVYQKLSKQFFGIVVLAPVSENSLLHETEVATICNNIQTWFCSCFKYFDFFQFQCVNWICYILEHLCHHLCYHIFATKHYQPLYEVIRRLISCSGLIIFFLFRSSKQGSNTVSTADHVFYGILLEVSYPRGPRRPLATTCDMRLPRSYTDGRNLQFNADFGKQVGRPY